MSNKGSERHQDQLADQGWQKMRALLDQEMPVRKKRFILWYWAGAAAASAMIGILAVYLWTQSNQLSSLTASAESLSQDTDVINHDPNAARESGDLVAIEEDIRSTEEAISSSSEKVIERTRIPSGSTVQSAADPSLGRRTEITEQLASDQRAKLSDNQSETALSGSSSSILDEKNGGFANNQIDLADAEPKGNIPAASRVTFDTGHLIIRDFSLVIPPPGLTDLPADKPAFIPVPIEAEASPKRIDFSTELALISESQYEDFSYDVGVGIRYRPTKILALGTGAFSWQINADQQFVRTTSAAMPDFNNRNQVAVLAQDQMDQVVNNPSQEREVGLVDKLSYLRVPLYVQFFPASKWQPRIGLNHLLLLANRTTGVLQEQSNGLAAGGANIAIIDDFVRKSNYTYELGLTFRASNRLQIDLSYNQANQSYLNYEVSGGNFYQYHQFVRMSAGFRF